MINLIATLRHALFGLSQKLVKAKGRAERGEEKVAKIPSASAWPLVYLAGVLVVVALSSGVPGAIAIIGLSAALPAVLSASRLRKEPSFGLWIFALVPTAFALWRIAGDDRPLDHAPVLAVGLFGAGLFVAATKGRAILVPLGALAIEVWLVAYLSSGHGSGGAMLRWLLAHGVAPDRASHLVYAFRKTVHLVFYGSVGVTTLLAARGAGSKPGEAVRTALLAVLVVASFDELRQSGYADRTGSAWDVLLDTTGGCLAVGLLEGRRRRVR